MNDAWAGSDGGIQILLALIGKEIEEMRDSIP